jgi:subtilase family serine protease
LPTVSVIFVLLTAVSMAAVGPSVYAVDNSSIYYRVRPIYYQVASSSIGPNGVPGGIPFCETTSGLFLVCQAPTFLKKAYDFPTGAGAPTGAGQTILIADAFLSPTIANDLQTFDTLFGLPAPPSFTILCPTTGCVTINTHSADQVGWGVEMSLDVEWAHAAAPGASIVLVSAASDNDVDLPVAEARAISLYPGSVLSQSFGIPEFTIKPSMFPGAVQLPEQTYVRAEGLHVTALAAAGDYGATWTAFGGDDVVHGSYPATSPENLAVGGTMGDPYLSLTSPATCAKHATCDTGLVVINGGATGCTSSMIFAATSCYPVGYGGEQVWNEYPAIAAATGGAPTAYFARPSWQFGPGVPTTSQYTGCPGSTPCRLTADVSLEAGVNGGVLVYTTFLGAPITFIVGGTSVATPIWAGIIALLNQVHGSPVGFVNSAIYALARSSKYSDAFHDITVGDNNLPSTNVGFSAATGWDFPTGWGTPDVAHFLIDIQPYL